LKKGNNHYRSLRVFIILFALCALLPAFGCERANPPGVGTPGAAPIQLITLDARLSVVDDGANLTQVVGQFASLAYDSDGNPHIAYYDFSNGRLKYAWRPSGGIFTNEVVDANGDVGRYASLKLDRDNNPHIAYFDATNQQLKYARRLGSSAPWEIFVLDNPEIAFGHPGTWVSLAVGVNSGGLLPSVNISYIEQYYYDLRYLRWLGVGVPEIYPWVDRGIGGGFSPTVGGIVNGKTSLALDYNEISYILYYDASNADLRIARQILAGQDVPYPTWKLEQVQKLRTHEKLYFTETSPHQAKLEFPSTMDKSETIISQMTGAFQSVGILKRSEYRYLDSQTIEIETASEASVYRNDYAYSISYARADVTFPDDDYLSTIYYEKDWDEGFWNDLVIEPSSNGPFHACWYNADLGDLNYGTWIRDDTQPNGGTWILESVERGGVVGSYCSIDLYQPTAGANYSPVIAYFDTSRQMLRFASHDQGRWIPYLVDTVFTDTQNRTFGVRAGTWSNLKVSGSTIGVAFQDIDSDILLYGEIQYP